LIAHEILFKPQIYDYLSSAAICAWTEGYTPSAIQASFMKYTAQQLKRSLMETDKDFLETFKVNKYDRDYQMWKRKPLSVDLLTKELFFQKLEYIHYNPVTAGLCNLPEEYHYSSAKFYLDGSDSFGMLTHFTGN
jgi:putative transposase